jgi:hypothetical protein
MPSHSSFPNSSFLDYRLVSNRMALFDNDKITLIQHMMDEIEACMQDNDFQREFFESLADQWSEKAFLSDKQFASLERIYERVTNG